jgi:hypothetical protein
MSVVPRGARRCASAEAEILRSKRHTGHIGFRRSFSEKKRERLAEKASHAPELVAVQPLNADWICHRRGGTGDMLMMETPGPACLRCVGLDDLAYLPAGDALFTRRAKAKSTRYAVVARFSRIRRRYERQGLLVEPQALADAR